MAEWNYTKDRLPDVGGELKWVAIHNNRSNHKENQNMFEIRCHWCRKKLLDKSGNFIDDYAGCLKDIKKSKLTRG